MRWGDRRGEMRLCVVGGGVGGAAVAGPVCMEELSSPLVNSFVCMRSKVIALCLEQVSRKALCSVRVVVVKGRRDGGDGNTRVSRKLDSVAPSNLSIGNDLGEEGSDEQVREFWLCLKRLLNVLEESSADDAASAPHQSNVSVVKVPFVVHRRRSKERKALRIRADLGGIKGVVDSLDERCFVFDGGRRSRVAGKDGRRCNTLVFDNGNTPSKHCCRNLRDGNTEIKAGFGSPLPCALLPRHVQYHLNHRLARLFIFLFEDV
mmetsp:Transcript_32412/g.52459  ORF Transcript_32412/g.52459 Transcript_32412/m.52459 type:complete len:262 (+) Transcript_32412:275-1060(+)